MDPLRSRQPPRRHADAVALNEKSIAVLPFVDLSPAKDQEYFSDGLAEDLLNLAGKAAGAARDIALLGFCVQGPDARDERNREAT